MRAEAPSLRSLRLDLVVCDQGAVSGHVPVESARIRCLGHPLLSHLFRRPLVFDAATQSSVIPCGSQVCPLQLSRYQSAHWKPPTPAPTSQSTEVHATPSYHPEMRMILNLRHLVLLVTAAAILVGACSSVSEESDADGIRVVATTTMLGDIAGSIVGDGGTVEVLLPIGADPHEFQPSSAQVSAIHDADLVIVNGLGLEEGLFDVLAGAAADGANVVEVAPLVDPVSLVDRQPCVADESLKCDPHVWLDPERDALIALIIGEELALADSSNDWDESAEAYAAAVRESDSAIEEILSVVPTEDRILVTNHISLGYFADRYGFEIVGSVIPGGSTLSEPSSADIAELVGVINQTGVTAIFAETTEATTLADAIASEADHPVRVIRLFTGSLGEPGSGADTLIGMLRTNAIRMADGLSLG
jgi:zinc/manganese transport system substrate-binding protein